MAEFGRLDVWVNNVGGSDEKTVRELVDTPDEVWRSQLELNLTSAFQGAKAAAARMAPGGVIVNIASGAGTRGSPRTGPYAAAKAGMLNLTQTLALELAPRGIRVNAVSPGPVATEAFLEVLGRLRSPRRVAGHDPSRPPRHTRRHRRRRGVHGLPGGGLGDRPEPARRRRTDRAQLPVPTTNRLKGVSDMDFEGKVLFATGGGSGIAAATARRFASGGGRVAVVDLDAGKAQEIAADIDGAIGLGCRRRRRGVGARSRRGRTRAVRHASTASSTPAVTPRSVRSRSGRSSAGTA